MSQKLTICIAGESGRMGQELVALIEQEKALAKTKPFDRKKKALPACDVVIDFSLPEGLSSLLEACIKNKTPLVTGVTGLTESQKKQLQKAAKQIPVLWSSNMSMGIATLKKMLHGLKPLSDCDFQIEETHHIRKKDLPSGTALTLQESLQKAVGKKLPDPVSIRGGGVFGIHTIHVMGEEETLTLTHSALNRTVFARGALAAARWLAKRKHGFYSLEDIL